MRCAIIKRHRRTRGEVHSISAVRSSARLNRVVPVITSPYIGVWIFYHRHSHSGAFIFPSLSIHPIACNMQLSGAMGNLVDKHHRLHTLQWAILFQKVSVAGAYVLLSLVFFLRNLMSEAKRGSHARGMIWAVFSGLTICGMVAKVSTVCIQVRYLNEYLVSLKGAHSGM